MMRILAPRLMSAVASFSSVASLPCALSIRYCAWVYPASAKASFRYGWSKSTHRTDDVVSGRITPTCRVLAPFVANSVSGLNEPIVDARSTVKELMLSPLGIVFEPLGAPDDDDGEDEPQAAATRLTTAARLIHTTGRYERERRPPLLLLLRSIPQNPFRLAERSRMSGCGTPYSTRVS